MTKKKQRDLEAQIQHRSEPVEFKTTDDERSIEFPFSSEKPVNRGLMGEEILDHREGSIDFARLNSSAPLLLNHSTDSVIGVVERGWLDKDKKQGRVQVRFANNALGKETLEMVRDGIYKNVSVGYSVNKTEEEGESAYRVMNWTPAEVSIVSVPADFSVGVGRAKEEKVETNMPEKQESSNMQEQRDNAVASSDAPQTSKPDSKTQMTSTPDLSVVREEASKKAASEERNRIREISGLCNAHGLGEELKETLIGKGTSIEEARKLALEKIQAKPVETVSPVEMDAKTEERYSIAAGIKAVLTGDWSSREAGLVRELSQEVERSGVKRSADRSFLIPYSALTKRATYVTSGATTGGNIVATDLLADDFIEALRANTITGSLGIRTLPGLVGDVAIPRRSGTSTGYWLSSETTAITQSESTFDQVTMAPKNYAALSKFSRQTLLQATPGIEELVRRDLTDTINVGIDAAVIAGSGSSGQPTGITGTSGIGSVAIGTNGGAITLETLINLEEEVLVDNAGGASMAYATNPKVLSELKKLRAGGSAAGDGAFLWNVDPSGIGRSGTPGVINGYPIGVSTNVPSNLTKGSSSGVCSAVIFGDFSQVALGVWGNGLEIEIGTDSDDFSKALTSVRAITTIDVAVRQASAFAACLDVTT
ncbi:MAG: phage major capsid protein [Flavobacteriaceae bacterium]|nr:phage major capsid protein [Flavobacteriaceae bacterium]